MRKPKLKIIATKKGPVVLKKQQAPVHDYLKYYRVVRYYVCKKHGITLLELEMLLFLYSEGLFTIDRIKEFRYCFPWKKVTFEKMLEREFIEIWREKKGAKRKFQLSYKAKMMVTSAYNMLNGQQLIPEKRGVGTMFLAKPIYSDKTYTEVIKMMNRDNKGTRIKVREPGMFTPNSKLQNSVNKTKIIDE
jgi:hypothetical protein